MHDLIIVGGGPAGAAAAVYAARKQLKTILVVEDWGGQSAVSSEIQNWIGTPSINGADLADALEKHVESYAKKLLISSGARRRILDIPGAKEYDQKGLTYCASCDGPLFEGKDVAIVGGGNAGFETALQLLAYCKNVTLLHRGNAYKADEINVEVALKHPNMRGIL